MKAFVTGGTGFIGSRLVQRLVEQGHEVTALVRSQPGAEVVRRLGAAPCIGDITERESMREGMRGADVVFHTAAWYKVGSPDWPKAEAINVGGTRNVLELALELNVPKVVYTSTIALNGDTRGQLVDERYRSPGESFLTEYDRTKWLAHYHAAEPLIAQGAPVVIVMPGVVYGPGDHSLAGQAMRAFYKGYFPIFPAPKMTGTFAHIDDIVEGHILAAEKGRMGERYILAGPVASMGEMLRLWAELTGRPAPMLNLPPALVKPTAPLMRALARFVPVPELLSAESIAMVDATYIARSDKAAAELGWRPRPIREGMEEVLDALARTTPAASPETIRARHAAGMVLAVAAVLFAVWRVVRRR